MKKLLLLIGVAMICSCAMEARIPAPNETIYVVHKQPTKYELAYVVEEPPCYGEIPYWWEPEWCDYYNDGSACCVWYVDGWLQEWCQWDYYDWCWEFNGYW